MPQGHGQGTGVGGDRAVEGEPGAGARRAAARYQRQGEGPGGEGELPHPVVQAPAQQVEIGGGRAAEPGTGRGEQLRQRGEEAAAGRADGVARGQRDDRERDSEPDRGAEGGLFQAQYQQPDGKLLQGAVELAEHDRQEEDHVGVGDALQVEAEEHAEDDHGQHPRRVAGGQVGQPGRRQQPGHRAEDAVEPFQVGLAAGRRAGEHDERGDDRPVVAHR
jgi:hypothetical protein